MLKIDLHTHTIFSGHAFNTMYEMAHEASEKKLTHLGITDHTPYKKRFSDDIFKMYERIPPYLFGVRIVPGIEIDIIDTNGTIELPEKYRKNLKIFSAGFHVERGVPNTLERNTKSMISMLDNPLINVITHPYLSNYPVDIKKVAEHACSKEKLLELNNSSFRYKNKYDDDSIKRAKKMIEVFQNHGMKMIIGSDAHIAFELGEDSNLMARKEELGFRDNDIINNYPKEVEKYFGLDE